MDISISLLILFVCLLCCFLVCACAVAVAGTGEVYGWGDNKYGQVGVPASSAESTAVPLPRLLPALIGVQVTGVACGAGHSVVCARDGRVFSW